MTVTALVDGKAVAAETTLDAETNTLWIIVSAAASSEINLQVQGETLVHDNADALKRCEKMILFAQHTIITKANMWQIVSDETMPLEEKCLQLNGKYQEMDMLSKAVQEMLSLTEDKYLGIQI